jgi:hypothetical protein
MMIARMIRSSGMPMPISHLDAYRLQLTSAERRDCTTRRASGLLAVAVLGTAAVVGVAARQNAPVAQFSSQVQLVEVYATVTDAAGGVVTDLAPSDAGKTAALILDRVVTNRRVIDEIIRPQIAKYRDIEP